MPKTHVVQPGEHLLAIVSREGFRDGDPIINHADNAALADRPHPNILDPGETITIPDRAPAIVSVATGKAHEFVVRRLKGELNATIRTFRGKATAATEADVTLGDAPPERVALAAGALKVALPDLACTQAVVTVPAFVEGQPDLRWALNLAGLGRGESDDGALARLRNLGYYRTVSEDAEPRERRSAIEEFQADQGLTLSGELDDATKTKIAEVHGC